MFRAPIRVFKAGVEVARGGEIVATPAGSTNVVRPGHDGAIEKRVERFFDDHMTIGFSHFPLADEELAAAGTRIEEHACRPAAGRA
jgi:hypothetical protein